MKQAYSNIYGGNWNHITATHKYVRFKPSNKEQLLTLTETLDLDLFDEPLDYKISYDGDFYQDPSIPQEEITWQYTVVPTNFSFPAGINYETLATIHIPADDYQLEAEAERLVGLNANGDDLVISNVSNSTSSTETTSSNEGPTCPSCETPICAPGYIWDSQTGNCIPDTNCPSGYAWDPVYETCMQIPPPVFIQTGGRFLVNDTQLGDQGVRNVRVVAKRWFKIERMYTNNNGYFNSTKKFRNKVKLIVKFKNDDASIRGLRGVRLYQMLLPIQKKFGPLDGSEINNFPYTFTRREDLNSKGTRNWVAATTHNAVQQFKDLSTVQGAGTLPANLKIVLSNWGFYGGEGAAPLFAVRWIESLEDAFIITFLASNASYIVGGLSALVSYLKRQVDITYSYNVGGGTGFVTSDRIVTTIFHELAHATLYNKAGADWYNTVVNGTIQEITRPGYAQFRPYGNGLTAYSGIIALNEAWGNHYGQYLAHQR